jgi:hypothetical protein
LRHFVVSVTGFTTRATGTACSRHGRNFIYRENMSGGQGALMRHHQRHNQ